MKRQKVKFNRGKEGIKTAFVFSCPGQKELKSGKLVNGVTGENLDTFIKMGTKRNPDIFPTLTRYDYRITNSVEEVYYKGYCGCDRTEATIKSIKRTDNLERLYNELKDYDFIITFGKKAERAVKEVEKSATLNAEVFNCCHLGNQGLNSVYRSIKEKSNKATTIRIKKAYKDAIKAVK